MGGQDLEKFKSSVVVVPYCKHRRHQIWPCDKKKKGAEINCGKWRMEDGENRWYFLVHSGSHNLQIGHLHITIWGACLQTATKTTQIRLKNNQGKDTIRSFESDCVLILYLAPKFTNFRAKYKDWSGRLEEPPPGDINDQPMVNIGCGLVFYDRNSTTQN